MVSVSEDHGQRAIGRRKPGEAPSSCSSRSERRESTQRVDDLGRRAVTRPGEMTRSHNTQPICCITAREPRWQRWRRTVRDVLERVPLGPATASPFQILSTLQSWECSERGFIWGKTGISQDQVCSNYLMVFARRQGQDVDALCPFIYGAS